MKKRNLLKLLMLLVVFVGGAVNASAKTGKITFGNNGNVKINEESVTAEDNIGNTWTITTVMKETSFSQQPIYSQVGSAKKPATSITFTTTLPSSQTITDFSAKFGGFNNTAGNISLTIGNEEVGSGSLNATDDVTVKSTKSVAGTQLTVTVTDIDKGVKCYEISYSYDDGGLNTPEISFSEKSVTATLGEDFVAPTFTCNSNGIVRFESSDESVATIHYEATGAVVVTPVGEGTTTITATVSATDEFEAGSASYILIVKKAANLTTYYKVKSVSQLVDGNHYIFVFEGDAAKAMGSIYTGGTNPYGTAIDATIEGDEVKVDANEINELTLGIVDNGYTFLSGNDYLSWSSGNSLTTEYPYTDASTWTIDDYFNIANVGTPERIIQFNAQSPRFACYTGTQKTIAIYSKEQVTEPNITVSVGAEGFATYTAPYVLNVPEDSPIKAYVATVSGEDITLTKVNVVTRGQGVLLYGEPNATAEWEISAEEVTFPGENYLVGTLKTIKELASENEKTGDKFYILNVGSKGIGFYAANGMEVPAGKAYLKVPASKGAKQFYSIKMATGISELNAEKADNAIYNLNGVRVKEMNQKGVYIVNGKKVVKK